MLGKIKNFLLACGGSTLVVLSFVGTISASLSWFTYNAKVGVSYSGTSITSNKQLQIGIVTDLDLTEDNFYCEEGIAWTSAGSGISPFQLNTYLASTGHATTSLVPLTSRRYEEGDSLKLYKSPYDYEPDNLESADKKQYIQVPLAFRVINVADGSYVENKNVWITETTISGQEEDGFSVSDGVRAHFNNGTTKFIYNPSKEDAGVTKVSGLLDLNEDGFYDFDNDRKEVVYGDYEGTPEYSEPLEENSELDDIYETGRDSSYVFLGAHKKGVKTITNYDSLSHKTQEYLGINDIAPTMNANGYLKEGKPICNTGNSKVGYTTMTIWVEGWDETVVDQISELKFEMSITFEIDKV